jgi:3-hydroxyisobutyrate dehydrogenase-like beta-hydroxyacid dehydrogenase
VTAALGFVGLGVMGGRMAKRLLDAGHTVVGYNRTPAKAQWLIDAGLEPAASPRAAAEAADVVFSMVTDTTALEAVTRGADGILAGLRRGAVYVEMSTVDPGVTRALGAEAAARGAAMLDAPVSGSVATLDAGQLAFMAGGEAPVLERVRPYLTAIGPTITHVGPLGLAVTMKIATNLGLAVQMLAFSEAVCLAEKAGIARERAVEALLRSVIASPMVKYRGPFVLGMPAEAWFDVGMMQKDLRLALDLARSVGVTVPTTALTHEFLAAAGGLGLADYDFAVVFDVLASLSGLPPSAKAPPAATDATAAKAAIAAKAGGS